MTFKMPKPAYQIVLGALMLTFVVAACNNKGKDKEAKKDSVVQKPTAPGDNSATKDSVVQKPTAPGDMPVAPGDKIGF
jgi:hypothetical protein